MLINTIISNLQELEGKLPYDVSVHLPCFQSQFPAVDDSEIKAMDQQISTLTQQIQNQHDEIKKLETGKHTYIYENQANLCIVMKPTAGFVVAVNAI